MQQFGPNLAYGLLFNAIPLTNFTGESFFSPLRVTYKGTLAVDTDGKITTNFYNERHPVFRTSARFDANGNLVPYGQGIFQIDATTDMYGVVPSGSTGPGMFAMGDQMTYTNDITGVSVTMQVGDGGPFPNASTSGYGETSVAGVEALGGQVAAGSQGPVILGPNIPVTVEIDVGTAAAPSRGGF